MTRAETTSTGEGRYLVCVPGGNTSIIHKQAVETRAAAEAFIDGRRSWWIIDQADGQRVPLVRLP